ncbi:amidase [Marinomonas posidonica]|uniref:Amidase n=1 Tax=Marinomonas posidonica (strain CECT 7376 / NCIMB 14433 / IVIA-Po-181) TaxID=491952 RepID=F6CS25_MARPP|nr:amidase [Marinomonas posidonica]AEF56132.1 Amidase [Marinomonas posidonica IVIA-Po-181]
MKHFIIQNPFLSQPESVSSDSLKSASLGQLTGLRLAVKDLFHMQGLPTTAGNPTWLATHPTPNSTAPSVVTLMANGAEFVGKTITDELAYSLNGQNIHYGTPENPVTPNRLPGGSTSGSAVAVSLGLADIGLGTDTGGSIRVPASYQGLFGLRPTHGAISAEHLVALAPSFDTVGWVTKHLDVLEKTAQVLLPLSTSDWSKNNTFKRVLVVDNLFRQVAHQQALQDVLAAWRHDGKLSSEERFVIDTDKWQTSATFRTLQGREIQREHGQWIAEVDPDFATDIAQRFDWCQTLSEADESAALRQRALFTEWLTDALDGAVLLLPTTPGLAPLFSASEEDLAEYRHQLMDLTAIAGLAGLPQLHLPVCELEGAPCGLSLVGPKGSDLALIEYAKSLLE